MRSETDLALTSINYSLSVLRESRDKYSANDNYYVLVGAVHMAEWLGALNIDKGREFIEEAREIRKKVIDSTAGTF